MDMREAADEAAGLLSGKHGELVAITERTKHRVILFGMTYNGPVYDIYFGYSSVCPVHDGLESLEEVRQQMRQDGDADLIESDTWDVRGIV